MPYITITDITNVIDAVNLQAMVDDYNIGTLQSVTLNNICQLASDTADSLVSSIYAVPFSGNPPKKIKNAAIIFAAEMLYQRRLVPDEKNPFKSQADYWRKELMLVNSGQLPLDATIQRVFTPVVFTATKNRVDTNNY